MNDFWQDPNTGAWYIEKSAGYRLVKRMAKAIANKPGFYNVADERSFLDNLDFLTNYRTFKTYEPLAGAKKLGEIGAKNNLHSIQPKDHISSIIQDATGMSTHSLKRRSRARSINAALAEEALGDRIYRSTSGALVDSEADIMDRAARLINRYGEGHTQKRFYKPTHYSKTGGKVNKAPVHLPNIDPTKRRSTPLPNKFPSGPSTPQTPTSLPNIDPTKRRNTPLPTRFPSQGITEEPIKRNVNVVADNTRPVPAQPAQAQPAPSAERGSRLPYYAGGAAVAAAGTGLYAYNRNKKQQEQS